MAGHPISPGLGRTDFSTDREAHREIKWDPDANLDLLRTGSEQMLFRAKPKSVHDQGAVPNEDLLKSLPYN